MGGSREWDRWTRSVLNRNWAIAATFSKPSPNLSGSYPLELSRGNFHTINPVKLLWLRPLLIKTHKLSRCLQARARSRWRTTRRWSSWRISLHRAPSTSMIFKRHWTVHLQHNSSQRINLQVSSLTKIGTLVKLNYYSRAVASSNLIPKSPLSPLKITLTTSTIILKSSSLQQPNNPPYSTLASTLLAV